MPMAIKQYHVSNILHKICSMDYRIDISEIATGTKRWADSRQHAKLYLSRSPSSKPYGIKICSFGVWITFFQLFSIFDALYDWCLFRYLNGYLILENTLLFT
jgi:hypothetical protein